MPDTQGEQFRHILIPVPGRSESFTTPRKGGQRLALPDRVRQTHARKLQRELEEIRRGAEEMRGERQAAGRATDFGLILEFISDPGFALKVESLDRRQSKIQLLNVRPESVPGPGGQKRTVTKATVRVPYGKLDRLAAIIKAYRSKESKKSGKPRNEELVAGIAEIRMAALEAFWTEESKPFPRADTAIAWEAWLHVGEGDRGRETVLATFMDEAKRLGITVEREQIRLPENTILLIRATRQQLEASLDLLNCLTELREPAVTAEFFTEMNPVEQAAWVNDALRRIIPPADGANAVCLLDTGANQGHPLLTPALDPEDLHAYDPAWGVHDTYTPKGHGTQMAGLALYGELVPVLAGGEIVQLAHRLESVKIFPPVRANDPRLYGDITRECMARPEVTAPQRQRVFSLQVTALETRGFGRPTSWSSTLDQLCAGAEEEGPSNQRLVCVSAGNTSLERADEYPSKNETEQVHDPGQAWNAITVGCCTEKVTIGGDAAFAGWQPLAARGALGPSSTTSIVWDDQWPFKPDVVMEGGNKAVNPDGNSVDTPDSLQLLTTNTDIRARLLTTTGDTSAATVLAARMAAIIQGEYPRFWPETVRALMIHSARWTRAMLDGRAAGDIGKDEWREVLRRYGYGLPNLGDALRSARNSVTLICQDEIQPFMLDEDRQVKTNELRLHELPWPRDVLLLHGTLDVEMRVTLSYFIEPNPGPRLSNNRYRYSSCGLRFDVRRPAESEVEFRSRINEEARKEDESPVPSDPDSDMWCLGFNLRHRGSIHSDIWRGTAADLAEKNHIAVFPVSGWWRLRKHLKMYDRRLRYSLVVTIRAPEQTVDIYTPIVTQVSVPVTVA